MREERSRKREGKQSKKRINEAWAGGTAEQEEKNCKKERIRVLQQY